MAVTDLWPKHDNGDLWDAADIHALLDMHGKNLTYAACAERLGRTVGAVRSKLYRLRRKGIIQ